MCPCRGVGGHAALATAPTPDTVGRGTEDDEFVAGATQEALGAVERYASQGYMRSNLIVMNGGRTGDGEVQMKASTDMSTSTGAAGSAGETSLESLPLAASMVSAVNDQMDAVREARMKGYEGDACTECGNFTLVRNGTCMKCLTCGATSGCS